MCDSCDSTKCPFVKFMNSAWDAKMKFMRSILNDECYADYLVLKKHMYKSCKSMIDCRLGKVEEMINDIANTVKGEQEEKHECCDSSEKA